MPFKTNLIASPMVAGILAQLPTGAQAWERAGIAAISIGATLFLWRHFTAKEEASQKRRDGEDAAKAASALKHAEADTAERNRLLEENNRLQQQVVDLLKDQLAQTNQVALHLKKDRRDTRLADEAATQSIKELARKAMAPRVVTIVNDPDHPVPVSVESPLSPPDA